MPSCGIRQAVVLVVVWSALPTPSCATKPSDFPTCDPDKPKLYDLCSVPPIEVHPTQSGLGLAEVTCKVEMFNGMSHSDLNAYLLDHPVPAVAGKGSLYIYDHHHLCASLHASDVDSDHKVVVVNVTHDLTDVDTYSQLFEAMMNDQLVWLYDTRGRQPVDPRTLPATVELLGNDIYRSLAYFVRCNGGYTKNDIPFQDFFWANYFQSLNLLPTPPIVPTGHPVTQWSACTAMPFDPSLGCSGYSDAMIAKALPDAIKAAAQPAAAKLPGFGPQKAICKCTLPK